MTIARRKYANNDEVVQAGKDAYDTAHAAALLSGESSVRACQLAKTARQDARVEKVKELVGVE